ncbi:NAD-dependent succinate-semialdehyde dehydrogenase [Kaistia sp. 32K]|uniref:NAD-dependent succinate-semialdehyde dehydrogenase n=1 Tax=Kaistia sp. 32K TaxID=2795690 RepID=UPI00191529A3|nr:NAD-dependent succinate-semialdehyde dehydrogenase [Kaistia sp. 32K]BCP52225.1 NAD-dependent succinate-semialdehyde dehydrogenase [Kaistia sp. 32K]
MSLSDPASSAPYPAETRLFIGGSWRPAAAGERLPVHNPADDAEIGRVAHARAADLEAAVEAAAAGFAVWRVASPPERAGVLDRTAALLAERAEAIGRLITLEQGKPLPEAIGEAAFAAEILRWFAGEARRVYGRTIPARGGAAIAQSTVKEPIGVVAAFTPWNFPVHQAVLKLAAAVAAGCSIVLKGPEETPASVAALVEAFADAGLPAGVINLVFGTPAEISAYLIPHPTVRKLSFTGSTAVGRQLAALAGQHLKRSTLELGGHAPVIVFDDVDPVLVGARLAGAKFYNAGQTCASPTRFLVQRGIYNRLTEAFVAAAKGVVVGNGVDAGVGMGPLAHPRRIAALEGFVADAVAKGARLALGGSRIGNAGSFFEPTVLLDVPIEARAFNEEPFGPIALFRPFDTAEEAIAEANRLEAGLAAYVYSGSIARATAAEAAIEAGMISVNHHGLALPELPFGGVKASGWGSEAGADAVGAYLVEKLVTRAGL